MLRSAENLRMPVTRGALWRFTGGGLYDSPPDIILIGADRLDEDARERKLD